MPKYLLERWSSIEEDDVHLATIRVYENAAGPSGRSPRIVLFLPPNVESPNHPAPPQDPKRPAFATTTAHPMGADGAQPSAYELDMVQAEVENQVVVAEQPKPSPHPPGVPWNTRARSTIFAGRIKHECNLKPAFDASYRRQMRERSRRYNTPYRQTKAIEDAGVAGGQGGINRLSSGVGVGSGAAFSELIVRRISGPRRLISHALFSENEAQASKSMGTHGAHATEPAPRLALPAFPTAAAVEHQGFAREDAAARGVSQGSPQRDRDVASQR